MAASSKLSTEAAVQLEMILDYIAGPDEDAGVHESIKEATRSLMMAPKADETIEGRAEGATVAYASLEQAEGRPVGRGADAWSWGLVVLEMFAGGRSWPSGTLAAPALERIARTPGPGRVPMPNFVQDLLRQCFQRLLPPNAPVRCVTPRTNWSPEWRQRVGHCRDNHRRAHPLLMTLGVPAGADQWCALG